MVNAARITVNRTWQKSPAHCSVFRSKRSVLSRIQRQGMLRIVTLRSSLITGIRMRLRSTSGRGQTLHEFPAAQVRRCKICVKRIRSSILTVFSFLKGQSPFKRFFCISSNISGIRATNSLRVIETLSLWGLSRRSREHRFGSRIPGTDLHPVGILSDPVPDPDPPISRSSISTTRGGYDTKRPEAGEPGFACIPPADDFPARCGIWASAPHGRRRLWEEQNQTVIIGIGHDGLRSAG